MEASQSQPVTATASPATSDAQPSAAWTPGPWVAADDGDETGVYALAKPASWVAITGDTGRDQPMANARLIAAAPDMHEALKEAAEWLDWYFAAEPAVRVGPSSIELRRIVRAALSKAETK